MSEYDAIRKRNSELEEQVKELKKLNESLKIGSKVILRKETVVEREVSIPSYDSDSILPTYKRRMSRDLVESSESYVNFEDVRLKVEQAMKDEINRSIHSRDHERQSYSDAKSKLDNEYNLKKVELEKEYKNKAEDLERLLRQDILSLLPKINKLATELRDYLVKRFFKPKHAIELAETIINIK